MSMENDDIDFMEDEIGLENVNNTDTQDISNLNEPPKEEEVHEDETNDDSFITELLKLRGIQDPSKIKFLNDNGEIEELDWNNLNIQDKMNVLNSSSKDENAELDDSEIELINAIRQSLLTPAEYLQYIQRTGVETYLLNNQNKTYSIDQYSDDELYVMDLISKSLDITEEEAIEALEKAKSNESLFKKLIGAIRNEYKKAEENNIRQIQFKLELEAQDLFNLFAEKVEDSIINFKSFSGGLIDMSDEDMQNIYNFITGTDSAGNNWFGKALQDTDTVVLMAWFVLYGEKMLQDITSYYEKEITNVRKESYNKGLEDSKKKTVVTYKPKEKTVIQTDDLDDF